MTLAYDLGGSDSAAGPSVVLLHSGICDRRMWDPQWQVLQDAGHRVLRCDFRGFGETPIDAGNPAYSDAQDVIDLLDELDITDAAVIGSSFGGLVAQEIAARWPARVSTLGLLCAATRQLPPTDAIKAFSEREDTLLESGDVEGAVILNVEMFLGPTADAATRTAVADMQRRAFEVQLAFDAALAASGNDIAPNRAEFDLADVTARTLVVSGGHDADFFQLTATMLASKITNATHVVLPWAGHLPSLEDPVRTNPLILDLLT
jgi:3-oxoadipate enol-lactonase